MKIAFIDVVHSCLEELLTDAGYTCEMLYDVSYEALQMQVSTYDGLVIRSRLKMNASLLSKATKLKFIARSGAGMENIDTDFAQRITSPVSMHPKATKDAVGEQALACS